MNQPARSVTKNWPLPSQIPNEYKCLQLSVPDDPEYIQLFYEQLNRLATWVYYDRDTTKKAADVAQVWRRTLNSVRLKCAPEVINVPELPTWLRGGPECWIVDADKLTGNLNIVQRVHIDINYCPPGGFSPPDAWKVDGNQEASTMTQAEIDLLQQELQTLKDDLATVQAAANEALTNSLDNATDINNARQEEIASLRWYPQPSNLPAGWISVDGQRIPKFPTVSGDSVTLWDRVPSAWRDGDDVLLPLGIDILPISATRDSDNAAFGIGGDGNAVKLWSDTSKQAPTQKNVNAVRGRWVIYIGDATIS